MFRLDRNPQQIVYWQTLQKFFWVTDCYLLFEKFYVSDFYHNTNIIT